jgi:hypothetical protein
VIEWLLALCSVWGATVYTSANVDKAPRSAMMPAASTPSSLETKSSGRSVMRSTPYRGSAQRAKRLHARWN